MSPLPAHEQNGGWLPEAQRILSPNFDDRPIDNDICLVVIHAISLPPGIFGGQGIIDLFTNQLNPEDHPYYREISSLRVSAHFLIRRNGELIQFVSLWKRAWHAGVSEWAGRERCNDFSIGIELEGCDELPFEKAQYATLNSVLADLRIRHRLRAVVAHSEIASGRKTDPGPLFDWNSVIYPAESLR
ncbi:MAG: 1,6-anhydro-N-acetylmuramyl-L-alanine amidase AmpD [Rugosibacter sp.]|nr:1,6-anhydro-N-acetylmuramyl-L-alanine amidase AmpD [Rugosibacter sp.]